MQQVISNTASQQSMHLSNDNCNRIIMRFWDIKQLTLATQHHRYSHHHFLTLLSFSYVFWNKTKNISCHQHKQISALPGDTQPAVTHGPPWHTAHCGTQPAVTHGPLWHMARCDTQPAVTHSPHSPLWHTALPDNYWYRLTQSIFAGEMYLTIRVDWAVDHLGPRLT